MNSSPDLFHYQEEFPDRQIHSVTIYDRQHQETSRSTFQFHKCTITGLFICNIQCVGKFINKSYTQYKNNQTVNYRQNLINATKEVDHPITIVVDKIIEYKQRTTQQQKPNPTEQTRINQRKEQLKIIKPPAQIVQEAFSFVKKSILSSFRKKKQPSNILNKDQFNSNVLNSAYNEDALFDDIII